MRYSNYCRNKATFLLIVCRSALFYMFLVLWTLFWGGGGLPLLLLPSRKRYAYFIARNWAAVVIASLKYICGIKYRIDGFLPNKKGGYIVASKHQSAWETIYFLSLFEECVFILKEELCKIPVYGWYLKPMGMIAINRREGVQSIHLMREKVSNLIEQGKVLVIFPEGTRVLPGAKSRYKSGVMSFYPDIPIVPVALNSGLYWPKHDWLKKPGLITVRFLPALDPIMDKAEAFETLSTSIEKNSEELCGK